MEQLWRDLCLAGRTFVRQPGFALTAIVTLAVGLAANAAIFALLDAIVLRPLAFRDLDRLVQVFGSAPTKDIVLRSAARSSAADFLEWRQQVKSAEALIAYGWWDATVSAAQEPERVQAFRVSPGFFGVIGIELQGRGFLAEEGTPGRDRVAVISHALWTRKYASDPRLIGRTIRLDGEPYTVVGIAPPRFDFPMGAEVWAALSFTPEQLQNRWRTYRVVGRLRDGRTAADLQAELATIARRQAEAFPDTNRGWTVNVMPLAKAVVDVGNGPFLAMWQVSALLLLLMACVNVASLLLVRGASRHKELALRLALGAHRGRIVRQLLVESLALSLAGALVAIPLTSITLTFCRRAMPARIARFIPGWEHLGVDLRLIAVMAACASVAAVVFGLMPALRASRVALTESLKEGGRSPARRSPAAAQRDGARRDRAGAHAARRRGPERARLDRDAHAQRRLRRRGRDDDAALAAAGEVQDMRSSADSSSTRWSNALASSPASRRPRSSTSCPRPATTTRVRWRSTDVPRAGRKSVAAPDYRVITPTTSRRCASA